MGLHKGDQKPEGRRQDAKCKKINWKHAKTDKKKLTKTMRGMQEDKQSECLQEKKTSIPTKAWKGHFPIQWDNDFAYQIPPIGHPIRCLIVYAQVDPIFDKISQII